MDGLLQTFSYIQSLRILVCVRCACAVPPRFIATHLIAHVDILSTQRCAIAEAAHQLPELAWEPYEFLRPEPRNTPRIAGLAAPEIGFVCDADACRYTCRTARGIAQHCRKEHGWASMQSVGGDARKKQARPPNAMWQDNQPCQRLFTNAGWPGYIAIMVGEERPSAEDAYSRFVARRQHIDNEEAASVARDIIKGSRRQLPNPWLEKTFWTGHLLGRSRSALLEARTEPIPAPDPPARDERDTQEILLERACIAARRVVRQAFRTAQPHVVGRPALELIERRESGAASNEKPFYSGHKSTTVRRYSREVVRVLCYIWRTCNADPLYSLTHSQRACLQSMKRSARSTDLAARIRLRFHFLCFWIGLLDHALDDDEHKNALISGIAVLGLKPDHLGRGWYEAFEFSPVLSALITTSKALVVLRAYQESQAPAPELTPVHVLVKDKAERFMQLSGNGGIVSPMNRMLRLRTLAISFARSRNASGMISWDGDKLLVERQSFTLIDLQCMMQGLYETTRLRLLCDVLLLDVDAGGRIRPSTTALPPLDLDRLVDQPSEAAAGFSFLKHPENLFIQWQDWLLRRVVQEPCLQQRFGSHDDAWRPKAVQAYMKDVRTFKEGLFALVHMSAGAPARGSEVTSILCENGDDGSSYRGVFLYRGAIAFVTTYHKGYSKSNRVKTIHRFVPREVGELVVYFLALARPFIVDVQRVQCQVRGSTSFLWEPPLERAAESDDSSDDEGLVANSDDNVDTTDNDEDGSASEDGDEDEGGGRPLPQRPTPASARREPSTNPDGYWGTDRVRRVLREYTGQFLGATLGTRLWRHAYPAIHRELGTSHANRDMLDSLYFDRELRVDETRALQSGHTLRTEETNYGRQLAESPRETDAERERFRRVSEEWHQLLRFPSALVRAGVRNDGQNEVSQENQQRAALRWAALASVDLEAAFRAMVKDPTAEFRGRQREALDAICQRRLRVLVVMATGAGKSALFMLPASAVGSGHTIVIAPLTALLDDLLDRCERAGIPSTKWDGRRPPYWARIVFVTPESAVSAPFGRFLDALRAQGDLDRIVIDECHTMLESTATWRPDVLKLVQMTTKDTQVIYLTATLPPIRQPCLLQLAGLNERSLTVCRDQSTARTNIAYSVVEHERAALLDTLKRLVAEKQEQYGPDAQMIVYCRSKEETHKLAEALACPAFTSDMGTQDEKARMVRAFASGRYKLCTATPVLGLGLDAPGVRVVFHTAMTKEMEQYVQESGRAGRGGAPSESLVLVACSTDATGRRTQSIPSRLGTHAKDFLQATHCRRVVINGLMDGQVDQEACKVGEAACDLCNARRRVLKRPANLASLPNSVAPPARASKPPPAVLTSPDASNASNVADSPDALHAVADQLVGRVRQEQAHLDMLRRRVAWDSGSLTLERLREHLTRWTDSCPTCHITLGRREAHGEGETCPKEGASGAFRYFWAQIGKVEWAPYSCCQQCLAPQAICNRWRQTDEVGAFTDSGQDLCQFKEVMLHTMASLAAFERKWVSEWAKLHLVEACTPVTFAPTKPPWRMLAPMLAKRVKLGGRDASGMAQCLLAWGDVEAERRSEGNKALVVQM